MTLTDADLARERDAEIERLRAIINDRMTPATDDEMRELLNKAERHMSSRAWRVVAYVVKKWAIERAELREARAALAALARVKALCEQAVAEYQPHDVTPWVAVHELRAALAGES